MKPTRIRHGVIFFAVTLAIITYIDRICISQAAPSMRDELGLTPVQMGWAFSAFAWAYGLFEIPAGWMGDRWGARRVLTRIVIWWSFFTAATGWVRGLTSLLITRFLFGAGEAGCFPNLTKAFMTWLPADERVRAQGIMWLSARWGGAFTPLLVVLILEQVSWRRAFEIFGAVGVIWAIAFYRWYRDDPLEHKGMNDAEIALLPKAAAASAERLVVPWRILLTNRSVWLLWMQYFCLSFGWWFYITWLPTYLQQARGLTLQKGALLAGLPLFFGGISCLLCGQLSPWLIRRTGSALKVRRRLAYAAFLGSGSFLLLSMGINDPVLAMVVMGLAGFANDLVMPGAWATCMDLGGRFTGTLCGSMNMMGSFGAAMAPITIGYLLEMSNQNWNLPLYVIAGVYFLGMLCWLGIDPVTPLVPEETTVQSKR